MYVILRAFSDTMLCDEPTFRQIYVLSQILTLPKQIPLIRCALYYIMRCTDYYAIPLFFILTFLVSIP